MDGVVLLILVPVPPVAEGTKPEVLPRASVPVVPAFVDGGRYVHLLDESSTYCGRYVCNTVDQSSIDAKTTRPDLWYV